VIYDSIGREIIKLVDQDQSAGLHTVSWDGKDRSGNNLASGVYYYRIIFQNVYQAAGKCLLVK
jgi:flagellar hook assembly protein FlgD